MGVALGGAGYTAGVRWAGLADISAGLRIIIASETISAVTSVDNQTSPSDVIITGPSPINPCRVLVSVMSEFISTASVQQLHFVDPMEAGMTLHPCRHTGCKYSSSFSSNDGCWEC